MKNSWTTPKHSTATKKGGAPNGARVGEGRGEGKDSGRGSVTIQKPTRGK